MEFFKSSLYDFEEYLFDEYFMKIITAEKIKEEIVNFVYDNPDFRYSSAEIESYLEKRGWKIIYNQKYRYMEKKLKLKDGVFEAIQYDVKNLDEIKEFVGALSYNEYRLSEKDETTWVDINTPAGQITLLPGRWVVRVIEGENFSVFSVLDDAVVKLFFEDLAEEIEDESNETPEGDN